MPYLDKCCWRIPFHKSTPIHFTSVANNTIVMVGDSGIILTSTNNGQTWL